MKKLIKKGFTIVELVIVIAVIAILAGVLIPTFSGVVDKANQSAALQTARSTLTNALNMSSVAQLQGKDENGYHTVFVVDGYAFGYTGNQVEAIDYPGAGGTASVLKSGATYADSKWSNNFNAIMIAASNLKEEVSYTGSALAEGAKADGTSYYADDAKGTNAKVYDKDADVKGKYLGTTTYYLEVSISKVIAGASDFAALDDNATKGYTVTLSNGNYTVSDGGTNTASLYVNSDFSNKVVVFTTFAQ